MRFFSFLVLVSLCFHAGAQKLDFGDLLFIQKNGDVQYSSEISFGTGSYDTKTLLNGATSSTDTAKTVWENVFTYGVDHGFTLGLALDWVLTDEVDNGGNAVFDSPGVADPTIEIVYRLLDSGWRIDFYGEVQVGIQTAEYAEVSGGTQYDGNAALGGSRVLGGLRLGQKTGDREYLFFAQLDYILDREREGALNATIKRDFDAKFDTAVGAQFQYFAYENFSIDGTFTFEMIGETKFTQSNTLTTWDSTTAMDFAFGGKYFFDPELYLNFGAGYKLVQDFNIASNGVSTNTRESWTDGRLYTGVSILW